MLFRSFDIDNKLFSYLEFYGSSSDVGYNYTGSQPAKSWINTNQTGVSYSKLNLEMRRLYLFRQGDPGAEKLTPQKREQLFLIMLESLEPREADVIVGIFKKDLGVKGLTYKFIKDNIPGIVP